MQDSSRERTDTIRGLAAIDFIYFDAGGGHRAAATALKSVIEQQGRSWQVRLVNLQELLDELDIFRKITGIRLEDVYNLLLKKGWTLGSAQLLPLMHGIIRVYHRAQVRLLREFWSRETPDLVVSLVPNFNRALWQALQQAAPHVPYLTVLTDLADYPPHFWMERQPQYLICGTDRALEQAKRMGHDDHRVFRVSGMILRPHFYEPPHIDIAAERQRLGLQPDLPTGLVLFGGEGSGAMVDIARAVDQSSLPTQLIFICGRGDKLRARLSAMPLRYPRFIEGFTSDIPRYMRIADYFIGKPGPGSVSEALAMKLPVLLVSNAWTLPQERYNAEWVREQGVGVVMKSYREIERALSELLKPGNFARFRANAAAIENRAVFEIPDILAQILERSGSIPAVQLPPRTVKS